MQTAQRATRWSRFPDFNVSRLGMANCSASLMVVNQKLSLLANLWHVPPSPLHSMNGTVRKLSKHDPGLSKA